MVPGPQCAEEVAAADWVAEEMRRCRPHARVGRFGRHPVDAGKMEAADAARLMAARAGDVVQSALEAGDRANVLQFYAVFRCLLQRANNVVFAEYGIGGCALALHQTELRLQGR